MILLIKILGSIFPDLVCYYNYVYIYFRVAGHPLAQNEKCLHMFLIEPVIDKNYIPGKIRTT